MTELLLLGKQSDNIDEEDDQAIGIRLFANGFSLDDNDDDAAVASGKVSLPSDSNTESRSIRVLLHTYHRMLSVPPKQARKACAGEWDANKHYILVANPVNTISRTAGKAALGITYLEPEEWLLFFERGTLRIIDQQQQQHVQNDSSDDISSVWTNAISSPYFSMVGFRAYAILRRLGYIVVCPQNAIHSQPKSTLSDIHISTKSNPRRLSSNAAPYTYANVFRGLMQRAPRTMYGITTKLCASNSRNGIGLADGYKIYKPDVKYKKRNATTPHYTLAVKP
ncbi:hypothetical protein BX070DRAFT_254362 [Coemansia spiralis]|nr:hypothetical protein BX070DRAFT_254362 [Coemansia spiralis]